MIQPPILAVAGPTASGKTRLAVALAKALDGEVLSCDSMQIYRRMDIGTAKPTAEEMQGVPHHMIDVVEPDEPFSVGRYVSMADPILQDILRRGKACIVCGGTGLYLDSLLLGRSFAQAPETGRRAALEAEADQVGMEAMLEKLRAVDPAAAARLHVADRKRILRALEVYQETGKTITQHNLETMALPPKYDALYLGLTFSDRAVLYDRIDRRVDEMLAQGLLREIEGLLAAGIPPTATSLQAIGYKEPIAALRGEITMDEAVERVKRESRRYAKRQLTWLRRNEKIHWIVQSAPLSWADTWEKALEILRTGGINPTR